MQRRTDIQQLGELLRQARLEKAVSARELGERIGVHHSTITMLERGQIEQPRPEKLQRLARALTLDATDVLTLAGYQPSDRLPGFGVYLRTTTALPDEAIDELRGYFDYLHDKYSVDHDGPADGEDE